MQTNTADSWTSKQKRQHWINKNQIKKKTNRQVHKFYLKSQQNKRGRNTHYRHNAGKTHNERKEEGSTLEEGPRASMLKRIFEGEVLETKGSTWGERIEGCEKKYTGGGTSSGDGQKDFGREVRYKHGKYGNERKYMGERVEGCERKYTEGGTSSGHAQKNFGRWSAGQNN